MVISWLAAVIVVGSLAKATFGEVLERNIDESAGNVTTGYRQK
jgi:hypothetical protein